MRGKSRSKRSWHRWKRRSRVLEGFLAEVRMANRLPIHMVVVVQTKSVKRFRDLLIERHQVGDIVGGKLGGKIFFTHITRRHNRQNLTKHSCKHRLNLLKPAFAVQSSHELTERKTEKRASRQRKHHHDQQSPLQRHNHQNLLLFPPRKVPTLPVEMDGTITEIHMETTMETTMGTTMGTAMEMNMEIIISTLVKVTTAGAMGVM